MPDSKSRLADLLAIMARLRDPSSGCPWDLEQDFTSISPHTIEEAFEVDEAIRSGDLDALRDELGDLLFQVVFQARLAEEQNAFDFEGVVEAIVDKLIRRHPHVFGDAKTPSSVEGQRDNWEEIKAVERAAAGGKSEGPPDPFAGIPRNLPALARSAKVAGRLERLEPATRPLTLEARVERSLDDMATYERDLRRLLSVRSSKGSAESPSLEEAGPGSASVPGRGFHEDVDPSLRRAQRRALIGRGLNAWVRLARTLEIDPEQALRTHDDEAIESIRARRGSS